MIVITVINSLYLKLYASHHFTKNNSLNPRINARAAEKMITSMRSFSQQIYCFEDG